MHEQAWDNTPVSVDFNFLSQMGNPRFSDISYTDCGNDLEAAKALADANPMSLILTIDLNGTYRFHLLRTDECDISVDDANSLKCRDPKDKLEGACRDDGKYFTEDHGGRFDGD